MTLHSKAVHGCSCPDPKCKIHRVHPDIPELVRELNGEPSYEALKAGLDSLRAGLRTIATECGYPSIPTDALSIEMILQWVANAKLDIAVYKRSVSALEMQNSRVCALADQMASTARGLVDENERMRQHPREAAR